MNVSPFKHFFYLLISLFAICILLQFKIPRHEYLLIAGAGLAVLFKWPQFKFQIIAFISLLFHFIPDPISRIFFENAVPQGFGMSFYQLHVISMTLCLTLCVLFLFLIKKRLLAFSHFKFLFAFIVVFFLASVLYKSSHIFFPLYTLVCMARFIWPLCYLIESPLTQEQYKKNDLITLTGLLAPFWSYGLYYLPVPLGPQMLFRYEAHGEKFKDSVLSGTKLLLLSVFLTLLFSLSYLYFFGRANTAWPFWLDLQEFLRAHSMMLPNVFLQSQSFSDPTIFFHKKVLALIVQDLFFVLELFPTFGVAIALARLSGVRLPRMIYRPLQARSFVQYMGSFLYYYQQLLFKLFVRPALGLKKTMRLNRKVLVGSALLVGGFLFHYFRDLIYLKGATQFGDFTLKYSQVFIYLFIIAYAVTYRRENKRNHSYFRVLLYFLIHPFVILSIMFVTRAGQNLESFGLFLKDFFGL